MIIVSDTAPLNYLILIDCHETLFALFGTVAIPSKVFAELQHTETPEKVRELIANRPKWLDVRTLQGSVDDVSDKIHAGEREAIALAEELNADLLLIDDKDGRQEALKHCLAVTGTLGVLKAAAQQNLLDLPEAVNRLRRTTFREPKQLVEQMLKDDAERRRSLRDE